MPLRNSLNEWLSVILKIMLICVVALLVIWGGLSVWANVFANSEPGGIPKMPSVSKAQNIVLIKATGQVLLTKKYDQAVSPNNPADMLYTLHGYYEIADSKWRWRESTLALDEYYFGDITVKRRSK